ncbi:IS630 family transposase [Xenorhabdus griffiniae]|uniref:IS630 family transposase n=2 Tax=Xenorhabdus griffiniae TaxID=351672 RepID=A0ABY9XND0_9GAMM|nr:IS630 family transposase [Xenorhabdus griffiniae]WMV74467.1 IS630 family transposase [Xenorhabdus griffiniae]WNH04146.1 IS630 family transposase [Xenorhabdus griffiniae]
MKIHLTPEQKCALELMHDTTRNSRVCDRIKAVLLASEGWTAQMIAQALRIHESTVSRHLKDFIALEKLTPENGGSESHLSAEQTADLIDYLTANLLHTTAQIVAYVRTRWQVSFSVGGMTKWLHRQGFSYKKPKGVPHKFDANKQQQFIDDYPSLKDGAGQNEPILFIDAVHPSQSTTLSYGWMKAGKNQVKVVETTGSRTRLNILGALNLQRIEDTVIREYPSINAENIAYFFGVLRETYPLSQKIHLILDGAGYHRAEWVKKMAYVLNIELHYLPPYSPNLNPIERLWKYMNEQVRNNVYFPDTKTFRETLRHFFHVTLPEKAKELTTRLTDNFQILKPSS